MNRRTFLLALLFFTIPTLPAFTAAQDVPSIDRRLTELRHLDLTYTFPGYATKEEWLARAEALKKQILASAGLLPMPVREPINATIFGKVDRGDHTVEKVYFESHPGFYVTGNLYRPKDAAEKLPAVLCPHGHWTYGRLENQQHNSGPGRPANFARQGYVAFSYDMVGYVDSAAISHKFAAGHRENIVDRDALWSVNLLGLQLWNSIRSIDFLLSLPEVDPERIGCTGESGGGTQTFLLMAIDDRIKVAAPVNMVSFYMQGGSLCENAPNLRIDTNNVEIASLMAPRPLMLVAATGDWTKKVPTEEYPAIRNIYRLFGAEEKVTAVQMDAPHNYNQESREAVYGWFAHWLQSRPETDPIRERGGGVASITDLMVFFGRPRPENELSEELLSASIIAMARRQLEEAAPRDAAGLEKYRETFGASLKLSLMAEFPSPSNIIASNPEVTRLNKVTKEDLVISRKNWSDRVAITLLKPDSSKAAGSVVVLVSPDADSSDFSERIVKAGHTVLSVNVFSGGRKIPDGIRFFTTYNRTDDANRVQDILTAIAYAQGRFGNARISLAARGQAGLWALLARGLAPRIDRSLIDVAGFDTESDEEFVRRLPIPGLRRAGDLTTAVALAPFTPLSIYNGGGKFRAEPIETLYRRFGRAEDFKPLQGAISDSGLIAWLTAKPKKK
jgi:cephalosporin-C deacetylase-like acetyl esterase